MNMNKKFFTIIIVLLSLFICKLDVFAKCSDAPQVFGANFSEAQCASLSEDGYRCTITGSTTVIGSISFNTCGKSSECDTGYKKSGGACVKDETYHSLDIACSTFSTKEECGTVRKCEWRDNSCKETYVAELPCSEDNIKTALRFFGFLLLIAKIAIPLIIIIMGTFDLFKSVVDKDEKSLSKQMKMLLTRLATGVFIFFIPNLIYAVFSLSETLNVVEEDTYDACMTCLFKPTECDVKDSNNNNDNNNN